MFTFRKAVERWWHGTLRRPFRLHVRYTQGTGEPVIMLHGIGRTGQVWEGCIPELTIRGYAVYALDLLGFGKSPRPDWSSYDPDVHAQAVIKTIKNLGLSNVRLVGHSMGGLIAVRVALLAPQLVSHLVLYEMPLYHGLPQTRKYRLQLRAYTALYERILDIDDAAITRLRPRVKKLLEKHLGWEVEAGSWLPFSKSLQNTILHQDTSTELRRLAQPIDLIYGSRDFLVIRGQVEKMFGTNSPRVEKHIVRAGHEITPRACKLIAERLDAQRA